MPTPRRIDAHQHFWVLSRGDYSWLTPAAGILYRDYLPEHLQPHLQANGIEATVLVQAAPTVAETEFLLELSDRYPFIAGVVGWLDLEGDDFPRQLERLQRHPNFKGVRPMLQDLPDDAWILRPRVQEALRLLAEREVAFDFLVFPRHLPHVVTTLEAIPGLRAVIDHLAKPPIARGELEPWRTWLARVAQFPGVMCKLSGMVTEADHQQWRPEHLAPYVHHALDLFGPDRVMFGSDWPVCLLAASYDRVVAALREALGSRLTPELDDALFGGNAARFYRL